MQALPNTKRMFQRSSTSLLKISPGKFFRFEAVFKKSINNQAMVQGILKEMSTNGEILNRAYRG
jgi:hypothetical protein